jgi:predicted phosphodiesterase
MTLSERVAIMSDIHGEHRMLDRALDACRELRVPRIVLLGDLFDRHDQIEQCLQSLAGWNITGVLGNHERDALRAMNGAVVSDEIVDRLGERLILENALFIHDSLELNGSANGNNWKPHIVFAGHTHVRQARDQHGPLDISLGQICLRPDRRYLINPGAIIDGKFAIWDRNASIVRFERV